MNGSSGSNWELLCSCGIDVEELFTGRMWCLDSPF
jgi:hypothetical protein